MVQSEICINRQGLLSSVRLMAKAKEKREEARKNSGVDSDDWEIAFAAQMAFQNSARSYISILGGMAGEW